MEKKMLEHYKDNKRSELRFIKNQWKLKNPIRHGRQKQLKRLGKADKVRLVRRLREGGQVCLVLFVSD